MSSDVKNKILIFFAVIIVAILFLVPTFSGTTGWFSRPISLGLDLRGGAHLVYEVQVKEAVQGRLQNIANSAKSDLRKDKIPVSAIFAAMVMQSVFSGHNLL